MESSPIFSKAHDESYQLQIITGIQLFELLQASKEVFRLVITVVWLTQVRINAQDNERTCDMKNPCGQNSAKMSLLKEKDG